jgi:hypothetical protein
MLITQLISISNLLLTFVFKHFQTAVKNWSRHAKVNNIVRNLRGIFNGTLFPVSLGFGMSGKLSGDRVQRQVPQHDNVTAPRSFVSIIYNMETERPVVDLLAQL